MEDLTLRALDLASREGAAYADVRQIHLQRESLVLKNGSLAELEQSESIGIGVRAMVNGAWGFASTDVVTAEAVDDCARRAVAIAKSSAACMSEPLQLALENGWQDVWTSPCAIDPFAVPLDQKLGLLKELDARLRTKPEIASAIASMHFQREEQLYVNTDGARVRQVLTRSGAGFSVLAIGNGEAQRRSYPQSWGGNHKQGGYEVVLHYDLLGNAERIRDEAIALLTAEACPQGDMTLILDGPQMALQIHESVGHANELDRVLGWEANYAGRSFMTRELHQGGFEYGSSLVNLVADSTLPGGLATFGYDDDGVAAQRFHVVQAGQHRNWFTTRDTAHYVDQGRSNACNRAYGYGHAPITRIPNLSLMPGTSSLARMIAETEDGVYMETNRSWSIDQLRLNFQFGCEIGHRIKGGKIVGVVKNPTYQGVTPEFWRACDAIGNDREWEIWGVINCGKGQPAQTAEMSHGSAPTRFQKVRVGVR